MLQLQFHIPIMHRIVKHVFPAQGLLQLHSHKCVNPAQRCEARKFAAQGALQLHPHTFMSTLHTDLLQLHFFLLSFVVAAMSFVIQAFALESSQAACSFSQSRQPCTDI